MRLPLLLATLLLPPALACVPYGAEPPVERPDYAGIQATVAIAGADLEVLEGTRVQLDGHASRSLTEEGDLVLAWSQVAGPAVVLTNPSSPSPAFVAPLAPATLVFRLRAESGAGVALDEVTVEVREELGAPPFFVEVPRDIVVDSGEAVTFPATVVGNGSDVTIEATPRCDGDVKVEVEGGAVTVLDAHELPCLIFVDAVDAAGRRAAPAARVLWPAGTPLAPATRLGAPVVVEPGASASLSFEEPTGDTTSSAWPAGGSSDGLLRESEGVEVPLVAPLRRTRLVVGGARRRGPASGGVRYAFIDVTAGAGNRAPSAAGGGDRGVRPGASFTLTTSRSFDLDGDPITVEVSQVIGPAAEADELVPGLFHAPDVPATLLFHVTAFDGRVYSEPDAVRVVVDAAVENQPPVLSVEPKRWVAPGTAFTVDASAAYDPDSGFIERWSIAQDPNDPVLLLPSPVEEPFVALTAGADGEVYHFRLSAFDEDGQGVSADLEVVVERAGPYVDAASGSDEQGDGTESAPFKSLAAALEVALRHQLPELRIASGAQLPFTGHITGVDVVGGYEREGDTWTQGAAQSLVPVAAGGLVIEDAALTQLSLDLGAADASLRLAGTSALAAVEVREGPTHEGPLLEVAAGATVSLTAVDATASAPTTSGDAVLLLVEPGAALRLRETTLTGGAGGARVGVSCDAATIDVIGSDIVATSGATEGVGIAAVGCDMQLLDSRVSGGTATARAVGVEADDTLLYVAPDTTLSGAALGSSASATALLSLGGDSPIVLAGTLSAVEGDASALVAVGVDAASSRIALVESGVSAQGDDEATAVRVLGAEAQISGAELHAMSAAGEAVALDLLADEVVVEGTRLSAVGGRAFGVRAAGANGVSAPRFDNVLVDVTGQQTAAGLGLGTSRGVLATGVQVRVQLPGSATSARGLGLRDGTVSDSVIEVTGGGEALGVVVATGGEGAILERSRVLVVSEGGSAVALLGGAPSTLRASFLRATSPMGAIAVDARAALTLRHTTAWAAGTALLGGASTAVVDAANTLLIGASGFERTSAAPEPALASHLAIVAERPWVDPLGGVSATEVELEAAGCFSCFPLADARIDESGHLLDDEDHPLVDRGAADYAVASDIDGELVPFGALPDIGCDERTPPAE